MREAATWTIFLLPLASFAIISLVIRPFLNRYSFLSGLVLIAALATALGLSVWTLRTVIAGPPLEFEAHEWLKAGDATIALGLLVDPLTAIMLVVVSGVSLMVQVYSQGYMRHDPSYSRYFAFMSLFSAAMLGLVLASNIIQLYVFWELVGVSSYLLIGFWHHRPAAAAAAKKAFIITRVGDVGFLISILYLFFQADQFAARGLNPFHIPDIWEAARPVAIGGAGILAGTALTWVALGIFSGAAGKSAQFPFHAWLPDAMEGPTPVSALIHAATMVAAGVFLVARFHPVFQESSSALSVVVLIGAFTAFMSATIALVMNDIKRVMAYSTISQLGYMMAALGVGAYGVAIFHLFTHAFFKALLFLGAGSVNHATGTFDMRYMGGLRRYMPWTYGLVVIGALSLVGIFPLAGFWSKDEVLHVLWTGSEQVDTWVYRLAFIFLIAGVLLTAFYTLRMIHLTFHGEFRGGVVAEVQAQQAASGGSHTPSPVASVEAHHPEVHLAESPLVMILPMLILGVAAAVSGYLANPLEGIIGVPKHWITEFLVPPLAGQAEVEKFNIVIAVVSSGLALAGIAIATALYLGRKDPQREPLKTVGILHTLLSRKYYVDELYEDLTVRRFFYRTFARVVDWVDRNIVDGSVDAIGWIFRNVGRALARVQTGQVQSYGVMVTLGILLIMVGYLVLG